MREARSPRHVGIRGRSRSGEVAATVDARSGRTGCDHSSLHPSRCDCLCCRIPPAAPAGHPGAGPGGCDVLSRWARECRTDWPACLCPGGSAQTGAWLRVRRGRVSAPVDRPPCRVDEPVVSKGVDPALHRPANRPRSGARAGTASHGAIHATAGGRARVAGDRVPRAWLDEVPGEVR
jgi:hypothetical protein